jgi:hypothetical protein
MEIAWVDAALSGNRLQEFIGRSARGFEHEDCDFAFLGEFELLEHRFAAAKQAGWAASHRIVFFTRHRPTGILGCDTGIDRVVSADLDGGEAMIAERELIDLNFGQAGEANFGQESTALQ